MAGAILKVLLVSTDAATVGAVRTLLHDGDRFTLAGVCRTLEELRVELELEPVDLVLVDSDPQPLQLLVELEPIINQHLRTRFIILADTPGAPFLMRAMQIGVRHVQPKAQIRGDLPGVMVALAPNGHHELRYAGELIGVLSCGGGCGATTVAINVADRLQATSEAPVLLADLDSDYGSVASYLALRGDYGLHNVLDYGERIDTGLIQSTVVRQDKRFDVLLSPATARQGHGASPKLEHMDRLLACCKRAYAYTVLDAPRLPRPAQLRLARACAHLLLVMQPAVRDVHVAQDLLGALHELGLAREQILIVLNRFHRRHAPIGLRDVEAITGGYPMVCLTNDYPLATHAILKGIPLTRLGGHAPLKRELESLAERLREPAGPLAKTNGELVHR